MELNSKIYTINDFIKFKDKIYRHCLFLEKDDVDKAEELFSETSLQCTLYLKDGKPYESDKHFINTVGRISYNLLLNRKRIYLKGKTLYFEDILNEEKIYDEDKDEEESKYEPAVEPNVFSDYFYNPDIHYMTSGMSYFNKKLIYELYLGATKKELIDKYGLYYRYLNNLKLNQEKFMGVKPEITKCNNLESDIIPLISNNKHKKIYRLYLNKVSTTKIAEEFNTSSSAIKVTINRINKKLNTYGYFINRRGEGAKKKA